MSFGYTILIIMVIKFYFGEINDLKTNRMEKYPDRILSNNFVAIVSTIGFSRTPTHH